MNSKDFRLVFLQRLNNFRALGMLDMPKKEYDITSKCFLKMTERAFEEKDKDSAKFLIIISQKFYVKEDGKKHYKQILLDINYLMIWNFGLVIQKRYLMMK